MKNFGLDSRSGIATAAVSLPVFLIGYCLLLFFESRSIPTLFFALVIIACMATLTVGLMQSVWTKKTYVRRLQKTTQALEEISQGKTPEQLIRERYVSCSDIKQCPDNHTIEDCLACELYNSQGDLEKIGVIVRTLGHNIQGKEHHVKPSPPPEQTNIVELSRHAGFIRRDVGYHRTK